MLPPPEFTARASYDSTITGVGWPTEDETTVAVSYRSHGIAYVVSEAMNRSGILNQTNDRVFHVLSGDLVGLFEVKEQMYVLDEHCVGRDTDQNRSLQMSCASTGVAAILKADNVVSVINLTNLSQDAKFDVSEGSEAVGMCFALGGTALLTRTGSITLDIADYETGTHLQSLRDYS